MGSQTTESTVKVSTRRCSAIAIDEGHEQLEQQHLEGKEGGIVLTDFFKQDCHLSKS